MPSERKPTTARVPMVLSPALTVSTLLPAAWAALRSLSNRAARRATPPTSSPLPSVVANG